MIATPFVDAETEIAEHNRRSNFFQDTFPTKKAQKLATRLMAKGFDWRSFLGLTTADLAEIDAAELKPGDTYCGLRLYGSKSYLKN